MRQPPIRYPITYTHEQHYTDSAGYEFGCGCAMCVLDCVCGFIIFTHITCGTIMDNCRVYHEAERKGWKCDKYHLHVTNSQKNKNK